MFTAILIGVVTTEIARFCQEHHITIRLPEVCPPVLTESFATIYDNQLYRQELEEKEAEV